MTHPLLAVSNKQVDFAEAEGKRVRKIVTSAPARQGLVIFEDGTFTSVGLNEAWAVVYQEADIVAFSAYLVQYGVCTRSEMDAYLEANDEVQELRTLYGELKQYQRLKEKFDTAAVS